MRPIAYLDQANRHRLREALKTAWNECMKNGYANVKIKTAQRAPSGHYNKVKMECMEKLTQ